MRRGNGIGWVFFVLVLAGLAYAALAPSPAVPKDPPVAPALAQPPRTQAETEKFLAATPRTAPQPPRKGEKAAPTVLRLEDEQVVWVAPGVVLRGQPIAEATPLLTIQAVGKIPCLERRGDFFRIRYEGREGWVHLPGYDGGDASAPPLGNAPDTLAPLLARDPDPALLAKARALLGTQERVGRLGPFELYTDVAEAVFDPRLDGLAAASESAYRARYGRVPVGDALGAVVLFASEEAYRAYERQSETLRGRAAAGHNSLGVVALYAGGRHADDVAATLTHELAHLLNRRILGPALPPWLDEGLCEDFAFSRFGPRGELFPAEIGGRIVRTPGAAEYGGPLSSFFRLRARILAQSLPAIASLAAGEPLLGRDAYDQVGAFFRFLIDGDGGKRKAGLRAFVAGVAKGGPPDFAALQAALGEDAATTEAAFRTWVVATADGLLGPA